MTQVPAAMRTYLRSKIHKARVTAADLAYVGSITIDSDLMERADIAAFEQVPEPPRQILVDAKNRFVRNL